MLKKIAKTIAVIVGVVGIAVVAGWIFDIPALKSILPQFVTMKFTTAVCFVLSGITLYFSARVGQKQNEWEDLILLFVNFFILLIMVSLIISVFVGIKTGMEDLFVQEGTGAINTVVPGRPALITMICFVLVACIGLLVLLKRENLWRIATICLGAAVAFFGSMAVVGYIVYMPVLYGQINNFSTAVALHTAILFVLLGVGFIFTGIRVTSDNL